MQSVVVLSLNLCSPTGSNNTARPILCSTPYCTLHNDGSRINDGLLWEASVVYIFQGPKWCSQWVEVVRPHQAAMALGPWKGADW